jgi:DNA invertase Pin-like site-specific DNA recombinase
MLTQNLPLNETFGYARVSTTEQETTLQIDALKRSGVDVIFQEKRSSVGKRPQL